MAFNYPISDAQQQKRPKSSVLRSFIHKRTPSTGTVLNSPSTDDVSIESNSVDYSPTISFLPPDHPHYRALGELAQNSQSQAPSSPKKSREGKRPNIYNDGFKTLQKKTMSTISLKSLTGKDTDNVSKPKEPKPHKPKKMKSSTNLVSLLSRPKSLKSLRKQEAEDKARAIKDKENQHPRSSDGPSRPPIYAQFSSELFTKQPLGGKFLEDEIDLYTPQEYSPGKQRNFLDPQYSQPTLTKRVDEAERQRSTFLPSNFSIQDITRRVSESSSRNSAEIIRRVSGSRRPSFDWQSSTVSDASSKTLSSRSQRVVAAVSSFGGKQKQSGVVSSRVLKDEDIDRELEAMLERRNIPEHQRDKVRNMAKSMKQDFIKQDWAEIAAAKNSKARPGSTSLNVDASAEIQDAPERKSRRARARTFTLSRSSSREPTSPTKSSKGDGAFIWHSRNKSADSTNSTSKSIAASGAAAAQNLIAKAKGHPATEFVSYLRKVQKPELVEVGRLHKLRLLLRNETVAWTDVFIRQGGMEEIVGLLHRTMEVEWREEHEDALLHEVLLCHKALATTALALEHLNKIQHTLFPALLHMLFDEERKGPSEFTTRNIITSLLFTYLKSAPLEERTHRARTLLSYLRNPEPSESKRPVDFVLDMRRERPYTVWCKEVVNVTKEVFWIFLHHCNVVPLPGGSQASPQKQKREGQISDISPSSSSVSDDSCGGNTYMLTHFPTERPPVPAAPYVGGVEWDATNYLASHLDLLNGIVSAIPSRAERNSLREQLRISGWEKIMGNTLRTCKEKFYGAVHAGLNGWVAAACADGWETRDVRYGLEVEVKKSPGKEKAAGKPGKIDLQDWDRAAPRIEMVLDFEAGKQKRLGGGEDVWL